jgi:hypothetical protein
MLEAAGQLTRLTRLELLQGLYMSWDLREIRHLSGLKQLQVCAFASASALAFASALAVALVIELGSLPVCSNTLWLS